MLQPGLIMDRPLLFIVRKPDHTLERKEILAFLAGQVNDDHGDEIGGDRLWGTRPGGDRSLVLRVMAAAERVAAKLRAARAPSEALFEADAHK